MLNSSCNKAMKSYCFKPVFIALVIFFSLQNSFAFQNPFANEGDILDSLLNVPINTASRHWQKVNDAPASVSIITAEDIKRYGYETLKEALQSVAGFYITDDRNYSYLGVRGFSRPTDYNDRIVLLLNGHKLNESVYGSSFIGWELGLNMESVERIEIVRGPGSSLYGTGAMFAVVNIITKDGSKIDGLRAGIEGGSLGKLQGRATYGQYFENNIDLSISGIVGRTDGIDLYFPEFDSPETNNGIASNLDWERYTNVSAKLKYGNWSLQNMVSARSKGIPTGAYETVFNNPLAKTLDAIVNTGLVYENEIDESKTVTVRSSYLHYFYEGYYPYVEELNYDKSIGRQFTLGGQLLWDVSSKNRLIIGVEGIYNPTSSYYNVSPGSVNFDKNLSFSILSAYIHDEYQLFPFMTAIFGLRSDSYSYDGSYLAPRIAAVITPSLLTTVKLLYGEAFRAPNFYELYYEDSFTSVVQSINLKPERISTSEAILEQRLADQYFAVLSVYRYNVKDLIDYQTNEADSTTQYRNIHSVVANGIEAGIQARYKSGISLQANYSYQHGYNEASKLDLTNSPLHAAKLNAAIPLVEYVTMAAELRYESERITLYNSKTSGYFLGNAALTAKLPVEGLECLLKVRNIFNRKYNLPGGMEHRQAAIGQNGRTIAFSLSYTFR